MRPTGRVLGPLLAVALAAAALPAAATAGNVSVSDKDGLVTFAAAPGEVNDLRITQTDDGFSLTDAGAPITAGAGCSQAGATKATCATEHLAVVARLGDQGDQGVGATGDFGLRIDGEGGNDRISSVTTNADLRGGPGDDDLTCNGRTCAMLGGYGSDQMRGHTAPGHTGGEGTVSYRDHPNGVRVTADGIPDDGNANDGPVGERDNVIATSAIIGGPGDDELFDGPVDEDRSGNGLYGMGGNDVLHGLEGSDLILGGAGTDHLDGGPGSDTLHPDGTTREDPAAPPIRLDATPGPGDVVAGGPDDDQVLYSRTTLVNVSLDGVANDGASGEGDDVATDVENITMGATGPSVLVGSPVANRIYGGWGDDDIAGGGGNDLITAYGGADRISGGPGDDIMEGNAFLAVDPEDPDILEGGSGNDYLAGGAGDDLLDGGLGADQLGGGEGTDTASYTTRTGRLVITLAGGGPNDGVDSDGDGTADERDNLVGIENLAGGSGADRVIGSAAANRLSGAAGTDRLEGLGGDDVLDGQGGADTLEGGDGADRFPQGKYADGADVMAGGAGADTVDYGERGLGVDVSLDGDPDDGQRSSPEGDDVRADVETVLGGSGADLLTGASIDNRLTGGPGNDVLDGGFGADDLTGGSGVDTVTYASRTGAVTADLDGTADDGTAADANAAAVRDRIRTDVENLIGGGGADTLTGDGAANRLTGGGAADALTGGGAADLLFGGDGDDRLFSRGDGAADTDACEAGAADEVTADAADTISSCEVVH